MKDDDVVEKIIHDSKRIEQRYKNINERMEMNGINNPTPSLSIEPKKETGGSLEKAQKIMSLMLELRKTRETLESQLTEIKSQAKSKISALRASEDALLDSLEEQDQMTLFAVDPSVSDEVKKIILNPHL